MTAAATATTAAAFAPIFTAAAVFTLGDTVGFAGIAAIALLGFITTLVAIVTAFKATATVTNPAVSAATL